VKAAISKQAPEESHKSTATSNPAALKAKQDWPSAEQMGMCKGWSHVRGEQVVKAITLSSTNTPNPQPVTEAPSGQK
jgi:hypothetical protein